MDEELRQRLAARGIPTFRWAEVFYEYDPEMYRAYVEWTTRARETVELDEKVREFISIAIDCVVMWPSPYIDSHFNRALDLGASLQELADVILAAGRLMGPHSYIHGFNALETVVNDRAAKGLPAPRRRADVGPQE
jgi:alkylhydroperoxidase/carboxymuconolactone decarboxylase family protein YurZ